jgi:hypothetical protein
MVLVIDIYIKNQVGSDGERPNLYDLPGRKPLFYTKNSQIKSNEGNNIPNHV